MQRKQGLKSERGAIIIIVAIMLSALLGMVGLCIDVGTMYVTKQKAQAAADSAVLAAIMDIYGGTNTGANAFGTSAVTCPTTGGISPCVYARLNGFGSTNADTVTLTFTFADCPVSGVTLSGYDTTNRACATISRKVDTTFMRVFGPPSTTVTARSAAAIGIGLVNIPIIILHPTLSGAFYVNGNTDVKVCGGPARSIQVNSTNASAYKFAGQSQLILTNAGPLDVNGTCAAAGTGGDAATSSVQSYQTNIKLGTKPGVYISSAAPAIDPLKFTTAPEKPKTPGTFDSYGTLDDINKYCPVLGSDKPPSCRVYSPGYYAAGILADGYCVFRPGIYWIENGGFREKANTIVRNSEYAAEMTDPATGTTWTEGLLIYNSPTGSITSNDAVLIDSNGRIGTNDYASAACAGGNCLKGSPQAGAYSGLLIFQNRATAFNVTHSLNGTFQGAVYSSHTSTVSDGFYHTLNLQGSDAISLTGAIIVDALSAGGGPKITLTLDKNFKFSVRQLTLAN